MNILDVIESALGRETMEIEKNLPSLPAQKWVLLTEMMRVMDYISVMQSLDPKGFRLTPQMSSILQWGWNLATEKLCVKLQDKGFPISKSTPEYRSFAYGLLVRLGNISLLRRVSDMVRLGFIEASERDGGVVFRRKDFASLQMLDNLDFEFLGQLYEELESHCEGQFGGWGLVSADLNSDFTRISGAYLVRPDLECFEEFHREDIDDLMEQLFFPWDSGYGVMTGYDAAPEVDDHFFSVALKLAVEWRNEVGIHPDSKFDGFTGSDLVTVSAVMISLHLKHVRFCLISSKKHKAVSLYQSLTIWTNRDELISTIKTYSNTDEILISRVLNGITFSPNDVESIFGHTTHFMPMLVELGNGILLRPISSLSKNPFIAIASLQEWRNKNIINELSRHREDWQRNDLYGLFRGTRYKVIDGNIKLRSSGKTVTDIDAAIYDTITGELAIFQLKWQDFFTNDVRKLRSRAKNLARELDGWASNILSWIERHGLAELGKSLRIKSKPYKEFSGVYLFAISKTAARVQGYGFNIENKRNIAVSNWPQFVRLRLDLGPSESVFRDLHDAIFMESCSLPNMEPLSFTASLAGVDFTLDDFWYSYSWSESQSGGA